MKWIFLITKKKRKNKRICIDKETSTDTTEIKVKSALHKQTSANQIKMCTRLNQSKK